MKNNYEYLFPSLKRDEPKDISIFDYLKNTYYYDHYFPRGYRIIDFNERNEYGQNALMYAICRGKKKLAIKLLDKGIDVNAVDKLGQNALIYTIYFRQEKLSKELLDRGIDINAVDIHGQNALMYAIYFCQDELSKELMNRGIDINAVDKYGLNALVHEIYHFTQKLFKELLKNWNDINAVDEHARNALTRSFFNKNDDINFKLLEKGINISAVDEHGRNTFMYAIYFRQETLSKELFDRGINKNFNIKVENAIKCNANLSIFLIFRGGISDTPIDVSIFDYAVYNFFDDRHSFPPKYKVKDINERAECGQNALMYAIISRKDNWFSELLEMKIDINAVDEHGRNALMIAICYQQRGLAIDLIERGININARDKDGRNALDYCIIHQQDIIGLKLIEKGIDINSDIKVEDIRDCTSIYEKILQPNELTQMLVSLGINMYGIDDLGSSPMEYSTLVHLLRHRQELSQKLFAFIFADKNILLYSNEYINTEISAELFKRGVNSQFSNKVKNDIISYTLINDQIRTHYLNLSTDNSETWPFIEGITDINDFNEYGHNALMYAIINRKDNWLYKLLNMGIDIDAIDRFGMTALMYAICYQQEKFAEELIKREADIHPVTFFGKNALIYAIIHQQPHIAQILIDNGIDINLSDFHLNDRINFGQIYENRLDEQELALSLTNLGINMYGVDENGYDYMKHYYYRIFPNHNYEFAQKMEAFIFAGKSVLFYSLEFMPTEFSINLIDKGANLKALNSDSDSILMRALSFGDEKLISYLIPKIENGEIDINIVNRNGENALSYSISDYNTAILLIELGIDIHKTDGVGDNILMKAIIRKEFKLAMKLIELGVATDKVNIVKKDALYYATRSDNSELIDLIKEKNKQVDEVEIFAINNDSVRRELIFDEYIQVEDSELLG